MERPVAGDGRGEAKGGLGFLRQLFGDRQPASPIEPAAAGDPIADATMLALQRQAIRPTPEAYTVWYRHLAGERPDLSRRLKDLEERGERFDSALIGELHERYFGSEREMLQVAEASRNAERLLAALRTTWTRSRPTQARGDGSGGSARRWRTRAAGRPRPSISGGTRRCRAGRGHRQGDAEMRVAATASSGGWWRAPARSRSSGQRSGAGPKDELDPVSGVGKQE
jgi:hypothetical protein